MTSAWLALARDHPSNIVAIVTFRLEQPPRFIVAIHPSGILRHACKSFSKSRLHLLVQNLEDNIPQR
jgi:hypothetical protein